MSGSPSASDAQRSLWSVLAEILELACSGRSVNLSDLPPLMARLQRALCVPGLSLLFFSPRNEVFFAELDPSAAPAVHPVAEARRCGFERQVLQGGRPLRSESYAYYPLEYRKVPVGVLRLEAVRIACAPWEKEFFKSLTAALSQLLCLLEEAGPHISGFCPQTVSRASALPLEESLSFLYRVSRGLHGLVGANELMHYALSSITSEQGGGFGRAMLLMVNHRNATLQGILGVTRQSSKEVMPVSGEGEGWAHPLLTSEALDAQRGAPFCQSVMQLRLSLDDLHHPLSRSALEGEVLSCSEQAESVLVREDGFSALVRGSYACAPLSGRNRSVGVLVVEDPPGTRGFDDHLLQLLKLFAGQVGQAMENGRLIHRLEVAHRELHEAQERMLQNERLAAIGEMGASMAHELRNPLVSLGGYAQRLSRIVPQGSQEQQYADIISREVRRLEKVLSGILNFSKKQILCYGLCHPDELVTASLVLEQDLLERAGIEVRLELQAEQTSFQGDGPLLRQVLLNLIGNARQAMSAGGTLRVRTRLGSLRGDAALVFEVEDTGGGIPDPVLRNIFNPFFTTKEEGSGLGLPICHRIVELHRGEIEVCNAESGARFSVRIPLR